MGQAEVMLWDGNAFVRWIGLEMGLHALILALIPLPVLVWGYLAPLFVGFG
jgi:hypothetical protein